MIQFEATYCDNDGDETTTLIEIDATIHTHITKWIEASIKASTAQTASMKLVSLVLISE